MATKTKEEILDAISSMTVLELSELVKAIEEKFGVTAAAPVAMMSGGGVAQGGATKAEAAEEKTEFTVILKSVEEGKKIPVIKEVKAITGLGLKEAKELVEAGERPIKEEVSKEEADKIKERIVAAGGVVEIK